METVSEWKSFGGQQLVIRHPSRSTSTDMTFSVFLPPAAEGKACATLFYLSGLTCTWENATTKAGFQRLASELDLIVICPDTSPRGDDVADDEAYDLGQGAGFYLNATEEPWSKHYRMDDYVSQELPDLIAGAFPVDTSRLGITGHSMGGHGALTLAVKNPDRFRSVSAFSPIVAPASVPWGQKAFGAYLGQTRSSWTAHDASALVAKRGFGSKILVDQGDADGFLEEQLQTNRFEEACRASGQHADIRMQPGYDHSYYFIATFMDDHLRHHAEILNG